MLARRPAALNSVERTSPEAFANSRLEATPQIVTPPETSITAPLT